MAMHKARTGPSGVTALYHRVRSFSVQYRDGAPPIATVEVGEYLNQEKRLQGASPVRVEVISFEVTNEQAVRDFLETVYTDISAPVVMLPGEPGGTYVDENGMEVHLPPSDPMPSRPPMGYEEATEV